MKALMFSALAILAGGSFAGCNRNANHEEEGTSAGATAEEVLANPKSDKGIGPIKSVKLAAIDPAMAEAGKAVFTAKCSACHKLETKYVGPALKGVTERRSPEWIMNMILNPAEMIQKDPIAKELLATHFTPMTFQNVNEQEVRQILEYFRQVDAAK